MSRLKLEMGFNDALFALSEGNPGAINVMMDAFRTADTIDPEGMGAWGFLLNLDLFEIYGSRIWVLFKDLCGENLPLTIAMVRSVQMGVISQNDLYGMLAGESSLNPAEVAARLKEKLPSFQI